MIYNYQVHAEEPQQTKRYTFEKLSKSARSHALEQVQERAQHDCDVGETLNQMLEYDYGMPNMKCWYSLGWCQGDGVAFEGRIDFDTLRTKDAFIHQLLEEVDAIESLAVLGDDPEYGCLGAEINKHNGGMYYHWNSMNVELEFERPSLDQSYVESVFVRLYNHLDEKVKEVARALEKAGYAELEYWWEEEHQLEWIKERSARFDEDGDIVSLDGFEE